MVNSPSWISNELLPTEGEHFKPCSLDCSKTPSGVTMVIGTVAAHGSRTECHCNEWKYGVVLAGGMTPTITLSSCVKFISYDRHHPLS